MKHKTEWVSVALLTCSLAGASAAFSADNGSSKPVSDSYITTKVKAELAKDKETKAKNIHVKTVDGVVSLRGTARSEDEKGKAEADARRVKGVSDVHNELAIHSPG